MSKRTTLICICGHEASFREPIGTAPSLCQRCGRQWSLPVSRTGAVRFEVIKGDLTYRTRNIIGYTLLVPLFLIWGLYYEKTTEPALILSFLPLHGLYFLLIYGLTDELRALHLIRNYRPLLTGWVIFQASGWLALYYFSSHGHWIIIAAFLLAVAGLVISLLTARPPLRYPNRFLAALKMLFRKPQPLPLENAEDQLPQSLVLLRSFDADRNIVETADLVVWNNERIFWTASLEETLQEFASANNMKLLKLGGEAAREGGTMIQSEEEYWQETAELMVQQTSAIVLVPGTSRGLKWEMEYLIRNELFFGKTLIWFPRLPTEVFDEYWAEFLDFCRQLDLKLPAIPENRTWEPILAEFHADASSNWIAVRKSKWETGSCRRSYQYGLKKFL